MYGYLALLAVVSLLAGCSPGMGAAVESLRTMIARPAAAAPELDPNFAYLRIRRAGHVGYLWRGSMEPSADGPIEVYYSTPGEVIRIQNGRIVGALGLTTEWRQVAVNAPGWRSAAAADRPVSYVRTRDVMPGYRSGVRDELTLRRVPPPANTALHGLDPSTLTWFEESARGARGIRAYLDSDALPPARYAVRIDDREETVVYSEQCLAPDLCFSWQRWSRAMQQAATANAAGAP